MVLQERGRIIKSSRVYSWSKFPPREELYPREKGFGGLSNPHIKIKHYSQIEYFSKYHLPWLLEALQEKSREGSVSPRGGR